jgi:hypothetical protein
LSNIPEEVEEHSEIRHGDESKLNEQPSTGGLPISSDSVAGINSAEGTENAPSANASPSGNQSGMSGKYTRRAGCIEPVLRLGLV